MPLPATTPLRTFIARVRDFGYEGPYGGGKHQFMKKGNHKLHIPNEHGGNDEVKRGTLRAILNQLGISEEEWLDG